MASGDWRQRLRAWRWLGLAAAAAGLGGCGAWDNYNPFRPAEVASERVDYVPGESPIYCYSTLARPDCFAEPQPGPPNRLIHAVTPE